MCTGFTHDLYEMYIRFMYDVYTIYLMQDYNFMVFVRCSRGSERLLDHKSSMGAVVYASNNFSEGNDGQ